MDHGFPLNFTISFRRMIQKDGGQTKKDRWVSAFLSALRLIVVYLSSCAHFWLATVQEVLQADWQLAWHSPQAVCASALMQGF